MARRFRLRSSRHREEAVKLAAVLVNGVALACLIGASFGPWLNPALGWGWNSLILLVSACCIIHVLAQLLLTIGFMEDRNVR